MVFWWGRDGFEVVVEVFGNELRVFAFYGFEKEFGFFGVFAAEGEIEGGIHFGGFVFLRIFFLLDFEVDIFYWF